MKFCSMRQTAVAAVALATGLVLVAPVARADPVPTPNRPARSGGLASPRGSAVLIVHLAPSRSVSSLVRRVGDLEVRHTFSALHAVSVQVAPADVAEETARLAALPGVIGVERAVERHFTGTPTPDDHYFAAKQARYLDAVRARQAWAKQHASKQIKIAVVDSGLDVHHPDLAGKVAGTYNAHDPAAPVTDQVGHGTFVAGVAAAETDNGVGVAGAGYDASIYAVKVADPDGAIELDDEVAGIRWATSHHVDVINLSLGGPDSSAAEAAAIAGAQRAGIVVVAAAGNDSDITRSYPAAYPGVIAVGATDTAARTRAAFSNYGNWVTVAAPGVGIFSTVPPAGSEMWPGSASYASGDGTSFSTPLVAGEVALLKAQDAHASVAQLRHAVVASAHGYRGLGLGAGQVDLALALAHIPPVSTPSDPVAVGSSGAVRLTAHSSAPRVAFGIDGDPRLHSVPVRGGVATRAFPTWGYRNGAHRLRAYDCTAYDECGSARRGPSFTIDNPAPTVTAPADGSVITGRAVVTAGNADGGSLRLLIDGRPVRVPGAAPNAFRVNTNDLRDGAHTLAVQGCSVDRRRCSGPTSAPVTVDAEGLHPLVTGLSPGHVSPNADHVRDAATLRFRLPGRETVVVRVLDARGGAVRSYSLGSLAAGSHSWVWTARRRDGRRLPDGGYSLVLDTAGGSRRGWVERRAVVDTTRPALARPRGDGARFYPYRDGYRDRLTIRTGLGEAGTLTLTVRSASGRVVRTVRTARRAGPAVVTWDGRRRSGTRVPTGRYRWQLRLTDAAGNATHSRTYRVDVSPKRLVAVTRYVTKAAAQKVHAGGTAPCAYARRGQSRYARGLRLVNRCASNSFELAYADYVFTLPHAVRYARIAFQVRGYSSDRPAELSAAFDRTDGSVEIPRYQQVNRSRTAWYTIAGVPAANHVSRHRRARMSLLLDSFYAGANDFDAASVRVRVRMTILR